MHDEFELDLPSEEEQLSAIAQSVRFAKDFAVIVAVCNDAGLRDRLIQRLAALLPGVSGRTARVTKGDDSLIPFLEEAGSEAYLNVIGMGDIVPAGTEGDEHPLVASLNANRNALPSLFGGVVILWLPAFLAAAIHRGAPDFFSIRSGLYRFAVSKEELKAQATELAGLPFLEGLKLEPQIRESRIARLLSLIEEVGEQSSLQEQLVLARLHVQLGDTYATGRLDHGGSDLAIQAWSQAQDFYQRSGNLLGQANMLLRRGALYYQAGRYHLATQALDAAYTLYQQDGNLLGQANVLLRRGDVHYHSARPEQANLAWDQAESLYLQIGNKVGEANILFRRGDLHYREGRTDLAAEAWVNAQQLFQQTGSSLRQEDTVGSRRALHYAQGSQQEDIERGNQTQEILGQPSGQLGEAHVLLRLGRLHRTDGRYELAAAIWNQAQKLFQRAGDPLGEANVLVSRGDLYHDEGRIEEALQVWNRAENLYKIATVLVGQANVSKRRGDLNYRIGRDGEALDEWSQAERLYQESGSVLGQAAVLSSRGLFALSEGSTEEARKFFGEAGTLYAVLGMALEKGETEALLCQTYPPNSLEARHHRAEAERIWREIGREDAIPDYFPTE